MIGKTAMLIIAAAGAVAVHARAQDRAPKGARPVTDTTSNIGDPAKTLRAAAEALHMLRYSDIGSANIHLPAVDVVNTMELWGSGTSYIAGQPHNVEYHASIAYNPPAMRVEITGVSSAATQQGAPVLQHTIQVVRDKYSWSESEIGAGLIPGRGIATPELDTARTRLLQLWTLPYGVLKAALAAGIKTQITTDHGAVVITFPLGGELAGVVVRATLNDRNEVARVETRAENPAFSEMNTETTYSDYADHGEILTDIKTPGHVTRDQNGRPVLDIHVTKADANNPYLVFPVPERVKAAVALRKN